LLQINLNTSLPLFSNSCNFKDILYVNKSTPHFPLRPTVLKWLHDLTKEPIFKSRHENFVKERPNVRKNQSQILVSHPEIMKEDVLKLVTKCAQEETL